MILLIFAHLVAMIHTPQVEEGTIYLFPGQGSDERVFQKLSFPSTYKVKCMEYPIPARGQSLRKYAHGFIQEIDTSQSYIFIGYSLGGMICTELADTLNPVKTIIISSAKSRHELPGRYTFQRHLPINKLIPKSVIKLGALVLQPLVEPDRKNEKATFKAMLKDKHPAYLKRTSNMIINWNREQYPNNIIHIHGDNDHTLPVRNVTYDFLVKDGSHMMVLTKAAKINKMLNDLL